MTFKPDAIENPLMRIFYIQYTPDIPYPDYLERLKIQQQPLWDEHKDKPDGLAIFLQQLKEPTEENYDDTWRRRKLDAVRQTFFGIDKEWNGSFSQPSSPFQIMLSSSAYFAQNECVKIYAESATVSAGLIDEDNYLGVVVQSTHLSKGTDFPGGLIEDRVAMVEDLWLQLARHGIETFGKNGITVFDQKQGDLVTYEPPKTVADLIESFVSSKRNDAVESASDYAW